MTIDPRHYGLIEMAMTFGIVAIFTVQQLWSLREKPPKDNETARPADDAPAAGEGDSGDRARASQAARHPERQHPLHHG